MGWGLADIIDVGRRILGSGGSVGSGGASAEQINEARKGLSVVSNWTSELDPGGLPDMVNYTGGPYSPSMVGWPFQIAVEAIGLPGAIPEGTFFIGHASPGMIMESFRMTQAGVTLALDYETKAGFVARLFQRSLSGQVIYIDGYEIGVERDSGRIVREDLRLPARSPLTAEVRYSGPIEPYLPLYIDISPYGDFGAVPDKDDLQVQVSATFLCQEVVPPSPIFAPF